MPLKLILIRHAKSDWANAGLSDHDRPLNARGRRAAPRIGAFLQREGHVPECVLCSTARRTQETWDGLKPHLGGAPDLILSAAIYEAMPADILRSIRDCDGQTLAVIGHNPGIGSLARSLAQTPPDHPKFALYPTGATTVLGFEADRWADIGPGQGTVLAFAVPKDLPDPS